MFSKRTRSWSDVSKLVDREVQQLSYTYEGLLLIFTVIFIIVAYHSIKLYL